MKTIILIAICATFGIGQLVAKTPTPSPSPSPTATASSGQTATPAPTPGAGLSLPGNQRATVIAAQMVDQVNNTLANIERILNDGVPAQGVSGADVKSALGSDNLAKIEAVRKALQGK